ncbi:MAG TPA: EAL domain-containing protein [Nocardioidaceae bacterium]|nr:EAL domain-containing protein [Nocardioidaceae bacterium]
MVTSAAPTRAAPWFNRTVIAAGALVGVVGTAIAVLGDWSMPPAYWLAVPVAVLISRFPIHLPRPDGTVEVGLESCVLAYLAVVLGPFEALTVWLAVAVFSSLLVSGRRYRAINASIMVLGGAAALFLIDLLRGSGSITPQELIAVGVGFIGYFLIDLGVSEMSIALNAGQPPRLVTPNADVLVALSGSLAAGAIGYLASLWDRSLPSWTIVLLVLPLFTLLLAGSAMSRERESARRMAVLLEASTQAQSATASSEVLQLLDRQVRHLMNSPSSRLQEGPPAEGEVGSQLIDGEASWWLVADKRPIHGATALLADRSALEMLASFGEEVLSRLALTRKLTHQAEHDGLTGLSNRDVFARAVEGALQRCRRTPTSRIAVVFCDLDGFKQVNDWFGHPAGDELLVDVGGRLRQTVEGHGRIARLGGDEFAMLVEEIADGDDLAGLTSKVLDAVRQRFEFSGRFVNLSTSVGVAFSDGSHSPDHLIRNADIAMYEAKVAGKDQVVVYHPALGRARVRSLELAEELREAIANREVGLVYQPIVQSVSGRVVGVEALARWNRSGAAVGPNVFIQVAEEAGLIRMLGELVMQQVASDAPMLQEASGGDLAVCVNISAQQLRAPDFVATVQATQESLGSLELLLELTERHLVGDDPQVLSVMSQLEASGVRLALDDFGIGFSSIGYLEQLAVGVLKTDRLFSARIDSDPRSLRLLGSMVSMGQALGLSVVIEGIERESQLETLRAHIPFGEKLSLQGYLMGRPAPVAEVAEQLRVVAPLLVRAPR